MASSEISTFAFDTQAVRLVTVEGEPWFVGKDVALVLGYVNPADAISKHCKGVVKRYPLQTPGGTQDARFITEGDLYRLVASSKLPAAERFEAGAATDQAEDVYRAAVAART